ncbi:MAG: hypothetical protein WC728_15070 [Elusimicrobiota bacterium]
MRYWIYMNGEVPGSYEPGELAALPGFGETSMVCPSEGEAAERNWQHAGQFPDILAAVRQAKTAKPPAAPSSSLEAALAADTAAGAKDANDILNDSSARIFRHVTELMKELENRREERALTQSLQRQVVSLKNEIMALRERIAYLGERTELIPGFEEREKGLQEALVRLRGDIQERDRAIAELEGKLKSSAEDLERGRRDGKSLSDDLKAQTRLAEELGQQLAAKEFTLAKAFGIIRRLESTLGEIVPGDLAGIRRELPELGPEQPAKVVPMKEQEEPVVASAPEEPAPVVDEAPPAAEAPDAPIPVVDEAPPAPPPVSKEVPVPWQHAVERLTEKVRGVFRKK